ILESHFQLDGFTTFARGARAILDADRNLYRKRYATILKRIFRRRGIGPVEGGRALHLSDPRPRPVAGRRLLERPGVFGARFGVLPVHEEALVVLPAGLVGLATGADDAPDLRKRRGTVFEERLVVMPTSSSTTPS